MRKVCFSLSFKALLAAAVLFLSSEWAFALWNGSNQPSSFTSLLKISGSKQLDCSGVLIAPRVVLTAGHCLLGARNVTARFGNEGIRVDNWMVNPAWSAGLPANGWDSRINASNSDRYVDLAVLLLQRAPKNAYAISLASAGVPTEQNALTTYGYARGRTLEPLYKIDSTKVSFLRRLSPRGPFKFSASGGSAWCQGDSGGPVTLNEGGSEKLVGIVGLGLGAISHDPASAVAMRWGGSDRVPKCGTYAYVQDVQMHAAWIEQASASLLGDMPYTSSIADGRHASHIGEERSSFRDRR